ncbi:MAG TPA: response regulator [Verrucomicrobiae bacterium]|nr:response regulator [Verrucomicrobiae bacterium]
MLPQTSPAAESYNTVVQQHLALEASTPIDSLSSGEEKPEPPGIADLKRAVATKAEALPQGRRITLPTRDNEAYVVSALALPSGALLVFALVVHQLKRRFNALFPTNDRSEEFAKSVVLEDASVAAFFHELRDGLKTNVPKTASKEPEEAAPVPAPAPVKELFASLSEQLARLRAICLTFAEAPDNAARQKPLLELMREASALKTALQPPELRPAWLLSCALNGLLKQLSRSNSDADVTESVIKTLTDALNLLGDLCVRGVNPNLASEHPVRLLAVDDDAVSRLAVSFALRQAFDKPDLAPNGETALEMIAKQKYDVIFLDVNMPSMDGYQLCKQIHQTENHQNTPVVFVTGLNDYKSRIMSRLSGGESHIAKPFLTFEITVKALTLVLRARLDKTAAEAEPSKPETVQAVAISEPVKQVAAAVPTESVAPANPAGSEPQVPAPDSTEQDEEDAQDDLLQLTVSTQSDEFISSALIKAAGDNTPQAFATHSPAYVAALRAQLRFARETDELFDQQKFLTRLLMGLGLLSAEANRVERRMVAKMCTTLERMLKKLLEQNQLCGPAMLNAASLALDLIEELATRTGTDLDLISQPVSILVVDDDPVARRALSIAIQMAFGRPEQADSGEIALELAEKKAFDLIFLDVLMPGMDGFTSCVKLHETPRNRQTPAVFVTGKNDDQSLSQAMVSGGVGFITKPVVPTQITLTALTFVLRNRLNATAAAARAN